MIRLPDDRKLIAWLVLAIVAFCVVLSLGGCTKREEQATTVTTEKKVTKTDETFTVALTVDTPTGPLPIAGTVNRTIYSEELTDKEANEERQSRAGIDPAAVQTMIGAAIKAALAGITGGGSLLGMAASPEGVTIIGSLLAALGYGVKKSVNERQSNREAAAQKARADAEADRRARAERDADEGWELATKTTKEKNHVEQ